MEKAKRPEEESSKISPGHVSHKPEFILIEEGSPEGYSNQESSDEPEFSSFEELGKVSYPLSIRFLSLFMSLLSFLSAVGSSIALLALAITVICTFGQVNAINQAFHNTYSWLSKSFVLTLGFLVAVFSASFGFAIIILYFMMLGEKINPAILRKMLDSALR